jgi:putative membrane protein
MLYLLSLHIIFVITWFAGLFYIVRLFVYHSEADIKPEPERSILINHFKGAERRLWYGITWPSAILAWVFGISVLINKFGNDIPNWLLLKLCFVAGLTFYHLMCGWLFNMYKKDKIVFSGMKMRLWNEVATVFLIAIIFIVILKSTSDWIYGLAGLIIFSALLFLAVKIYKKFREKKS